MTALGRLLRNHRSGDTHGAWNSPNLIGPELLTVTSRNFADGGEIPADHAGKRVGGANISPHLAWTPPPTGTRQLLLVVEDIDTPLVKKPAVHCLALIEPSGPGTPPDELPPGTLAPRQSNPRVRVLRSTIGRGYHGPEPLQGHGPHRYTFQLFALSDPVTDDATRRGAHRAGPRTLLASITGPVLARGRLTGVVER